MDSDKFDQKFHSKAKKENIKCPIKYDSASSRLWELLISLIYLLTLWIIPINMATKFISLKNYINVEIISDLFLLVDILIIFLSTGHTIN